MSGPAVSAAARYLPEKVGAPLGIFITGLILLGVALRLARTRKRSALPHDT